MKKATVRHVDNGELRSLAEGRLAEQCGAPFSAKTADEPLRLLHELQVHRIELEMQNAELRRAIDEREETERLLGRYTDLYDFAPVGYLTLARTGEVLAVNLTCTTFLGVERSRLLARQLRQFVAGDDLPAFDAFVAALFAGTGKQTVEVALRKERGLSLPVRMEAVADEGGEECRVAVIDISEQKRAQEALAAKLGELEAALAKVKQLEGIIPICIYCKKIRDDQESWQQLEKYITEHSSATFSHGACPECYAREIQVIQQYARRKSDTKPA